MMIWKRHRREHRNEPFGMDAFVGETSEMRRFEFVEIVPAKRVEGDQNENTVFSRGWRRANGREANEEGAK